MKDVYRACGKQVVLAAGDNAPLHYADARDDSAAQAIAYALNSVYLARLGKVDK